MSLLVKVVIVLREWINMGEIIEEVINANSHGSAINGSTGFLRISNVYVNSLDPSDIK